MKKTLVLAFVLACGFAQAHHYHHIPHRDLYVALDVVSVVADFIDAVTPKTVVAPTPVVVQPSVPATVVVPAPTPAPAPAIVQQPPVSTVIVTPQTNPLPPVQVVVPAYPPAPHVYYERRYVVPRPPLPPVRHFGPPRPYHHGPFYSPSPHHFGHHPRH